MVGFISLISALFCIYAVQFVYRKAGSPQRRYSFLFIIFCLILWNSQDFLPFLFGISIPHRAEQMAAALGLVLLVVALRWMVHDFDVEAISRMSRKAYLYSLFFAGMLIFALSVWLLRNDPDDATRLFPEEVGFIFLGYLSLGVAIALWPLRPAIRNAQPEARRQLQYMSVGIAILGSVMLIALFLSCYSSRAGAMMREVSYIVEVLVAIIIAYAVTETRLIDVDIMFSIAVSRILFYSAFGGILILMIYFSDPVWTRLNFNLIFAVIFVACIACEVFPPVYSRLRKLTDYVFAEHHYNYLEISRKFFSHLQQCVQIQDFLQVLHETFEDGIKLTLAVYLSEDFERTSVVSKKFVQYAYPEGKAIPENSLNARSPLVRTVAGSRYMILADGSDMKIMEALDSVNAKACIPFFSADQLLGFVLFGGRSGEIKGLTSDDVRFIEAISAQLSVVLERIRIYSRLLEGMEQARKTLSLMGLIREYNHEIKTPLTILEGNASGDFVTEQELRTIVMQQSMRIRRLLDTMLRIANDQRQKKLVSVNVNDVLESIIELFSFHKATSRKDLNPIPEMVGDYEDLQILFTNLFKNAMEAMASVPVSEQQISVKTWFDTESQRIYVSVSDRGVGIPKTKLKDIWKPYISDKVDKGGTGLGLSVVRRIVYEHRGEIHVQSEVGEGTTFEIWFPIAPSRKSNSSRLS